MMISRRTVVGAIALSLPLLTSNATATCYSIYDASDSVIYQSSMTPIDLSQPIAQEMARRFPIGHRLLITETSLCEVFRPSTASPAVFLYGNPINGTNGAISSPTRVATSESGVAVTTPGPSTGTTPFAIDPAATAITRPAPSSVIDAPTSEITHPAASSTIYSPVSGINR
jgi:hypothetical protein